MNWLCASFHFKFPLLSHNTMWTWDRKLTVTFDPPRYPNNLSYFPYLVSIAALIILTASAAGSNIMGLPHVGVFFQWASVVPSSASELWMEKTGMLQRAIQFKKFCPNRTIQTVKMNNVHEFFAMTLRGTLRPIFALKVHMVVLWLPQRLWIKCALGITCWELSSQE